MPAPTVPAKHRRAALEALSRDAMSTLLSMEERRVITERIAAVEARVGSAVALLQALKTTKYALVSVLLTGELRVTPNEDSR